MRRSGRRAIVLVDVDRHRRAAARAAAVDPGVVVLTCANCGARMDERKCKLICALRLLPVLLGLLLTDVKIRPDPIQLTVETPADAELRGRRSPTRTGSPSGSPMRARSAGRATRTGSTSATAPSMAPSSAWIRAAASPTRGPGRAARLARRRSSAGRSSRSPAAGRGSRLEHGGWPETTSDDTARDDHLGYWEAYLEDLAALLAG